LKATIHQPDFLPWLGLFNKIARADCWIVLDHVENNPRDAAFWGRRVKIAINAQASWLSITLSKPATPGVIGVPIRDMTVSAADDRAMQKCLRTLQMAYAGTPYFADYFPLAEAYFSDPDLNLMRRNMRFIERVMALLGVRTRILYSSELGIQTKATQLLVDLLKQVGASTYLCGGGAGGYQQDDLFAQAGIALEYNNFTHPVYPQPRTSEFIPGLSILDALFCAGEQSVARWVHDA